MDNINTKNMKNLAEGDYVWNALGNKLEVGKVTTTEYYLYKFGSPSPSPFSKAKVNNYIKTGEWTLKPKMAKGGNLKSIAKEYEENEDENAHSENVILLAKHFGSADDLKEAKEILARHNKEGHLTSENGKKRMELHLKLITKARKEMAKEGIKFAKGGKTASSKPKMVRTQFEEEEFEYAKGGSLTISDIKERIKETSPYYFSKSTMKFFGQTMRDFKVKKMPNGKYLMYAPMKDMSSGRTMGYSMRMFNPETNKLDFLTDAEELDVKNKLGIHKYKISYAKGGKTASPKPKMVRTQFEEEEFEYGNGGNISEGQMKILNALAGYNNGRNLNGILEGMFLSDFKSNKYATEAQTNTVKKNLNSLIKKGFVEEEGLGYSITQEGANYRRSNMAKGGKTASPKPKMVRTQFEEEEFEYGNGGLLSGFNYSIGGL